MSAPIPIENVVLKVVSSYVSSRLDSKYGLEWRGVKDNAEGTKEYNEKRNKIAKDAFLAVRARTGADFIDYFVSTICSVPQRMTDEAFVELSRQLHSDTNHVRTLTLLALSARS